MSGHKAKRHARQHPAPKASTTPPPAILPKPLPEKTCDCCCLDCDTIAWEHDDCDPYCDCEPET